MAEWHTSVAGTPAVLDSAGALWLPDSWTLVVADLHMEKASSFARHGHLLPPYDTAATLALLWQLVARRNPRRVVCLGDSFHDAGGFGRLCDDDLRRLAILQSGRDWIWVTGNHDRTLPIGLAGDVVAEIVLGRLLLRHEPRPGPSPGEVAGHLHPAAKVRGFGRAVRRRAFATDGLRLVLPAFGVLTGGLNVLDTAFGQLFEPSPHAVLIGDGRLFPVPFTALYPD